VVGLEGRGQHRALQGLRDGADLRRGGPLHVQLLQPLQGLGALGGEGLHELDLVVRDVVLLAPRRQQAPQDTAVAHQRDAQPGVVPGQVVDGGHVRRPRQPLGPGAQRDGLPVRDDLGRQPSAVGRDPGEGLLGGRALRRAGGRAGVPRSVQLLVTTTALPIGPGGRR
jgi:hypothetical protein